MDGFVSLKKRWRFEARTPSEPKVPGGFSPAPKDILDFGQLGKNVIRLFVLFLKKEFGKSVYCFLGYLCRFAVAPRVEARIEIYITAFINRNMP